MNKGQARVFEDREAVREQVPLFVGLMGPSFSGKTFSALRMATGIQRVVGGEIFMIDTESRRGLHYAKKFKYRHVPFGAPFSPLDYLAAVEHCVKRGAKVIVIDSMSHEHEGPGGVLEMHDEEVQRLGGGDRNNFPAWNRPKSKRRQMINGLLQTDCHFIFCFRAKEKTKPNKTTKKLEELGWMPIAGEEFIFEMTINTLLLPGAGGVPTWASDDVGTRMFLKTTDELRAPLTNHRGPLDESIGELLARWAAGDQVTPPAQQPTAPAALVFNRGFGEWAGKPVDSAPTSVISDYVTKLQGIAISATGRALVATQNHLEAVQEVLLSLVAEEAQAASSDDEDTEAAQ